MVVQGSPKPLAWVRFLPPLPKKSISDLNTRSLVEEGESVSATREEDSLPVGRLEIRDSKRGQYGVCLFDDNWQCEEWALLCGQCPVGGLKITGYEDEAQAYCTITGGKVEGLGTKTLICKRVDGIYCNVQANFDGDCSDSNDLNPNAGNVEAS